MAELKIKADSGGGTVSFKGPATTTSNAAVQLTLPVDDGAADQYLQTNGSGVLSWATVSSTPEGTAILSTGESGGTKFLREDGDGSCSWQTVSPSITTTSGTDNFTVADGNLVIGTSGHGIDFSADGDSTNASGTATGHLLHDYEEGTFDPVSEHGGVTSYNTRGGWYTKVGRVVHYQIYINMTLDSTSSGSDAAISGLPFTAASGTHISATANIGWEYGLGTNVDHAYVNNASTMITLLGPMSNGERDHVSHNEVFQSQASARLCISGSYWTSS